MRAKRLFFVEYSRSASRRQGGSGHIGMWMDEGFKHHEGKNTMQYYLLPIPTYSKWMGQGCLPKKINKTSQLRFFCAGDTPFRHLDFRAATFVSETCNKRNPPARAHPYPCSWLTTSARSSTENTTYQSGAVAYRLTGVGRQGGASRPQRSPVHNKKIKK